MAGEKRSQDQEETLFTGTTVLVDIEGTTTSISFVKETLFPYVRQNLKDYIESKWENEEFKQDYEKLKEQAKKDEEDKLDGFIAITGDKSEDEKDSLLKNILWQMDNDRKTGALKQLQGHMWREAYTTGAVKAHIYEDVPKAFESWTNDGRKIYVYSSGSVEAQKLLFEYSIYGNLLKYFNGFFDTEVGAKQECNSYKNILSKIDERPNNVIFLTDVTREAAAAKEAGLSTVIVVREGNAVLTDEEKIAFTNIKSFLDLTFQMPVKRQKLETVDQKVEERASDSSEPMDTSEDVEMSDGSQKKVEQNDIKEMKESVENDCLKNQLSEDAPKLMKKEEQMVIAEDPSNTKQEIVISETSQVSAKSKDMSEKLESSENADKIVKDDIVKDSDTIIITEKTEEKLDLIANEVIPAIDESMDVSMPEAASKSETASTSSEKKNEEVLDIVKNIQSDVASKAQMAEIDKNMDDKNMTNKSEECSTIEKQEVKEESKIISDTSESKEISSKSGQEEVAKMESTTVDVVENSETIETTTVAPTVTEAEATTSTADTKLEVIKSAEVTAENSLEKAVVSEKIDEKISQGMEAKETVMVEAEKCMAEVTKQETTNEAVKEENVVDMKDKNAVDSEQQKLNRTTQNGDTDVPVLDDKLHSNGLNEEGPSKVEVNSTAIEDAAAQNGEPESSSENSAESIKVKKVVDSTVADGAGEPDVVPPVVVAATS